MDPLGSKLETLKRTTSTVNPLAPHHHSRILPLVPQTLQYTLTKERIDYKSYSGLPNVIWVY